MNKPVGIVIILLIVVALVGLLVIYNGWYNIAATAEHNSLTLWMVETTKDNSIKNHAGDIEAPDLTDSTMIQRGFEHFDHMCIDCHGAPGIGPEEFAHGLYPRAPSLSGEIAEWSPEELFWITKHGIKLTGMPAFSATHRDDAIWDIVAFLQTLPEVGYYDYLEMRNGGAEGEAEQSGDGHKGHQH